MVSIIIPVYNLEKYVSYSIESALNQTYNEIEIVIVNDGSKDDTLKICREYADKHTNIKVISQENSGVSSARNTGLEHATGEYIMFLDGDDILSPLAVETLMSDINEYSWCIFAGFSYCRISSYKMEFENPHSVPKIIDSKTLLRNLLDRTYENIGVCAKLFKKEMIGSIRFSEGKTANEDKYFLFQFLLQNQGNVCERSDALYGYYIRPGSATQSKYCVKMLDTVYFSKKIIENIKQFCPELLEFAEYNDVVTQFSVLKSIIRSEKYKSEREDFKQIKRDLLKKYSKKKITFFRKYKLEMITLRISDYLYILCIYLYIWIKGK